MQSFVKIRGAVLEKNADKIMTLRSFNKDETHNKLLSYLVNRQHLESFLGHDLSKDPNMFSRFDSQIRFLILQKPK